MELWVRALEHKLRRLVNEYPAEWAVICGQQPPEEPIYRQALALLRAMHLPELELLLIWSREDYLLGQPDPPVKCKSPDA